MLPSETPKVSTSLPIQFWVAVKVTVLPTMLACTFVFPLTLSVRGSESASLIYEAKLWDQAAIFIKAEAFWKVDLRSMIAHDHFQSRLTVCTGFTGSLLSMLRIAW
jgi:hypothetical protein